MTGWPCPEGTLQGGGVPEPGAGGIGGVPARAVPVLQRSRTRSRGAGPCCCWREGADEGVLSLVPECRCATARSRTR